MSVKPSEQVLSEYEALGTGCGYHRFAQRTILELTGVDRTKFLHNFCTADIKRLAAGQGTEAFITNVQGKTVGYLYVMVAAERIVLENAAGQAAALLPHLGKYILLDDAELTDRSSEWASVLIAGASAGSVIRETFALGPPSASYGNVELEVDGAPALLAQVGLTGADSHLLLAPADLAEGLCQRWADAGATPCSDAAVTMRRVEAGVPEYGSEVTDANLPQELARDAQAISFTKGCYLGQETVARIDALGHVNRYLRTVRFAGDTVPDAAWEFSLEGKPVLKVTTAVYSPLLDGPLALAYVRRGHEKVGTHWATELGEAEVISPPGTE